MHGNRCARWRVVLPLFALLVPGLAFGQEAADPLLEQLRGTTYRLTSVAVGDQALQLPAKPVITIRFEENGKVNGRSTVNLYFGSLQLSAEGTITWGSAGFAVTRRSGPGTLMELESLFLQALERTTKLSLEGTTLTFSSADPAISMIFEAQVAQQAIADIYGKPLTLTQLNEGSQNLPLPAKPLLNLTITAEGTCYGFSGVNRFFGKLQIAADGAVSAGPFGSTMMAGPKELMDLETAFHKALASVKRVEVSGSVVKFFDSTGAPALQFEIR